MASLRMVGKVTLGLLGALHPPHAVLKNPAPIALFHQVHHRGILRGQHQAFFCSAASPSSDVSLKYKHDRLVLEVPLPSRNEKCVFYLRPMLMNAGDLINDLQKEDPGVTASVLSKDGERVANSTPLETLLDKDFKLVINDSVHDVHSPEKVAISSEHAVQMEDMKHMVHLLHTALNLPDHHMLKERELLEKLDSLKQELSPLEKMKADLSRKAEFHSSKALWTGMALLSVQGGALAWLTWWVYSWDVMEPVTYFITYATSMGAFAYYVLTKQDYLYTEAKDRQFLRYFYKGASKAKFNVTKYNSLKEELAQVEEDLRRLRYPTQLQLPVEQIQIKP
ncbi:calcium uniporter protein, mitochondrial [Boleophthalmus pectinirostris]|uniref:calcium uniporter protein, mitochondrial n=1 Tax=Boleophthalmus pectinirostris TaxID=150288 RepID=UPI000A1C44FD|nr:calcium uniporter protein, mitochondrial [Boleophthalmus pectinirostris]